MGDGHRSRVDGLSVHYYSDFRNSPERVASFEARGWYDVIHKAFATEEVIEQFGSDHQSLVTGHSL